MKIICSLLTASLLLFACSNNNTIAEKETNAKVESGNAATSKKTPVAKIAGEMYHKITITKNDSAFTILESDYAEAYKDHVGYRISFSNDRERAVLFADHFFHLDFKAPAIGTFSLVAEEGKDEENILPQLQFVPYKNGESIGTCVINTGSLHITQFDDKIISGDFEATYTDLKLKDNYKIKGAFENIKIIKK